MHPNIIAALIIALGIVGGAYVYQSMEPTNSCVRAMMTQLNKGDGAQEFAAYTSCLRAGAGE